MAMRAATVALSPNFQMGKGVRILCSSFSSSPFNLPKKNVENPPEPSTTLFVSGLSKRTTSQGLCDAFAKFGQVVSAKVLADRVSGHSKCCGFIQYETLQEAESGIKGMDGQYLDGWVIFAEYARPRALWPPLKDAQRQGQW